MRIIDEGVWRSRYKYVLVDEFQDISAGRMALLQALKAHDVAYFLVGDDWQSIYRFAGSDVRILRDCHRFLGHVRECTLSPDLPDSGRASSSRQRTSCNETRSRRNGRCCRRPVPTTKA